MKKNAAMSDSLNDDTNQNQTVKQEYYGIKRLGNDVIPGFHPVPLLVPVSPPLPIP